MKVEIEKRKDNPFLDRKELEGEIEHPGDATPSNEALKEHLANELNVATEAIEVSKIFTIAGMQKSKFWAKELEDVEAEVEEVSEESEETDEKEEVEEESKEDEDEEDYEEVLEGSISDAKEKIENMEDPDYEELLDIEKSNKDRKGMKSYLEKKLEE